MSRESTGSAGDQPTPQAVETAGQPGHNHQSREYEQFVDFFENASVPMHWVGPDGTILHANQAELEALGYNRDEYIGHHIADFHADQAVIDDILERLSAGEELRNYEARMQCKDGSIRHVLINSSVNHEDGEFVNTRCVTRDITERKQAKQERARRYEAIFNHTYQFTGLMDPDGTLLEANQTALEFGGIDPDDVLGNPFWEAHWWQRDEETKQELREAINRAADGEFVRYDVEVQGAEEDILIDFSIRPVTNEAGDVEFLIPEGRNITELKSLQEREEQLTRQNERLDEFASIVSHDLRNPLTVAEGNVELLQKRYDDERLDTIGRAHERMRTLIDELLTLTRDEASLTREELSLAVLAQTCWENVRTDGATLKSEIDQQIHANHSRLQQLLENLFRNALEHAGESPTITVDLIENGFYVEDDGPGIPAEARDDVFELGYTTSSDGTGYGLSIVKEIVDEHDWEITLTESEYGGARFELTGINSV